jgi:hypothetical protein
MRPFQLRHFILVFVASAVAAGSLLVAGSALAEMALFRIEKQFYGAPLPAATTPGGAGRNMSLIYPYVSRDGWNHQAPPATAIVEPGNPIGGAFTLPSGFSSFNGFTLPRPYYHPGYSSISFGSFYNGLGRFGPSNPYAATMTTRIVFPTTLGNPTPNYGSGLPTSMAVTTAFSGRYDTSRAGSIHVTPGPNRFGGTMRIFYKPTAFWAAYVYNFAPAYYSDYGSFLCQNPPGVTCTPSVVSSVGDVTNYFRMTRFLLNVPGTGTGKQTRANTAKATTPTSLGPGTFPTQYGNASYIAAKNIYLHTIHPWTTGFASAHNPLSPYTDVRPQLQGYDISLGGANITVTHIRTRNVFNPTLSTVTYTQETRKQYLVGVTRIVSMVRPRLLHVYTSNSIIERPRRWNFWTGEWMGPYQSAQASTMKVFFVPEPAGMLLLGAGVAAVLGLSRMRRR